jgi:hypothetical protein
MTMIVISVFAVLGVAVVVPVGRAIAGRRFERQLRLITLSDDRFAALPWMEPERSRARLRRPSALSAAAYAAPRLSVVRHGQERNAVVLIRAAVEPELPRAEGMT